MVTHRQRLHMLEHAAAQLRGDSRANLRQRDGRQIVGGGPPRDDRGEGQSRERDDGGDVRGLTLSEIGAESGGHRVDRDLQRPGLEDPEHDVDQHGRETQHRQPDVAPEMGTQDDERAPQRRRPNGIAALGPATGGVRHRSVPPRAWRSTPARALQSCSASATERAAAPSCERRAGSLARSSKASASDATSPGGTRTP